MNGSASRPHSESSGEFSLSLDAEVWSSESSPVQRSSQHNQRRRSSSHANEVLTLHTTADSRATADESEKYNLLSLVYMNLIHYA